MSNKKLKKKLSEHELYLADMEYLTKKKSRLVTWLLWFFVGFFGIHAFYLGEKRRGLIFLVLYVVIIISSNLFGAFIAMGLLIFWLVEPFRLDSDIKHINKQLEKDILLAIISFNENNENNENVENVVKDGL